MRTLNIYEIGVDEPPIPGLEICYLDRGYSFGFVNDHLKMGVVGVACKPGDEDRDDYFYGEIDWADCDDQFFNEEGYPHSPYLYIDDMENQLEEGDKWAYFHEYNDAFGVTDIFPFQEGESLEIAIKHSIVEELSREQTVIKKGSISNDGYPRPDCDLYYTDIKVWYNGKRYLLKFSSTKPDVPCGRLFSYESIDEV
ncbi:hypothetical protein [Aeromonas phage AS-sw]|uniref:Uncharacterized protein n=1 Tax=Aeromonas phage AS-sw TaxID=2026113 RepID=A0A291LFG2_9CAUD|nr:hypothetical protein HWB29_gp088 [Aeromonas phage AS-sw]ATI18138.1 hypothetical protein [Aeromonas phage AS-sw]